LQEVLGEHVQQKGSLVCADYLRFDFSHFSKLSTEELSQIEDSVNKKILSNIPLKEHTNMLLSEAKNEGAMMLFGEKYGDVVRMIQFDTSKELCGGTHVKASGEIGFFKIISESSTAAGIRRIEAISGTKALNFVNSQEEVLEDLSRLLKTKDIVKSVSDLLLANKKKEKELEKLKLVQIDDLIKKLLDKSNEVNGVNVISEKVDLDAGAMKNIAFKLKKQENLLVLLASENNGKAHLMLMITDDLVEHKKLNAADLINEISLEINGGGGGKANFATAGGINLDGIDKALKKVILLLS